MKKLILLSACLLLILGACKKKNLASNTLSATINGTTIDFTVASADTAPGPLSSHTLEIIALDPRLPDSPFIDLYIYSGGQLTTGNYRYQPVNGNGSLMQYAEWANGVAVPYRVPDSDDLVTITSVTSTVISGNFQGTLYGPSIINGSTVTVDSANKRVITNGKFTVRQRE